MGTQTRLILLSIILVVLVAAAGFIGYSIFLDSQAPDDALAGGGGGVCISDSSTPYFVVGQENNVCCENLNWFPVGSSCLQTGETPCFEYVYSSTNQNPTCQLRTTGPAEICGVPTSTIDGYQDIGGSCNTGSDCGQPPAGSVAVCWNNSCKAAPQNQCFWYSGSGNNVLDCDCGCRSKAEVCEGKSGTVTDRCTRCNNIATYDCGTPQEPTDPDPICGDGNVDPGEQCDDGNNNNNDNCTNSCRRPTTTTPTPVCGDGNVDPGEQCDDGNNINDDTCSNQCTPVEVESELDLNIFKEGASFCIQDGHSVSYRVDLINNDNVEVTYDELQDELPAEILPAQVTEISDDGELDDNTIIWPGGTIEAGETLSFSYRVTVTTAFANGINNQIQNTATVIFTDSNSEVVEKSFVNVETLTCEQDVELPQTDLQDNIMYFVAALALVIGFMAYKYGLGERLFEPMVATAGKNIKHKIKPRSKFEEQVLDEE